MKVVFGAMLVVLGACGGDVSLGTDTPSGDAQDASGDTAATLADDTASPPTDTAITPTQPVCPADCFACQLDRCDPVVALASGFRATCALLESGAPVCWGRSTYGALGMHLDGSEPLAPTLVADRPALAGLELAASHACGLGTDGTVWCWGDNYYMPLGVDRRLARSSGDPHAVVAGATELEVGPLGTVCAETGDGLVCWGFTLTGVESTEYGLDVQPTPRPVAGVPDGVALEIALGFYAGCVRTVPAGGIYCWGSNARGQLGRGEGVDGDAGAARVADLNETAVDQLEVGYHHACVVADAGSDLRCWGDNTHGAVGTGPAAARVWTPRPVDFELPGQVHELALGDGFSCAIMGDGRRVWCWGDDTYGVLGPTGTGEPSSAPHAVEGTVGTAILAAGRRHVCAVLGDETIRCWGDGASGQLTGVVSDEPVRAPVDVTWDAPAHGACRAGDAWVTEGAVDPDAACQVCGPNGAFVDCPFSCAGGTCQRPTTLSAGGEHTCARLEDGAVWCWGDARHGAVDGAIGAGAAAPVRVAGVTDAVQIDLGGRHGCAVTGAGALWCWGANGHGQTGAEPATVAPPAIVFEAGVAWVSAGSGSSTCALKDDDSVWCWGWTLTTADWGGFDGAGHISATPREVAGLDGAELGFVAVAEDAACATERSDSNSQEWMRCWGRGVEGQLGVFEATSSVTPIRANVFNVREVEGIDAGAGHFVLWGQFGRPLLAWGANEAGQGGRPVTSPALTTPAQLDFDLPWNARQASAGGAHTCLVDAAGAVWCHGANTHGQSGPPAADGAAHTARVVTGLAAAQAVAAGARHSCAIERATGWVKCWGDHSAGQLGDGRFGTDFGPAPRWVRGTDP